MTLKNYLRQQAREALKEVMVEEFREKDSIVIGAAGEAFAEMVKDWDSKDHIYHIYPEPIKGIKLGEAKPRRHKNPWGDMEESILSSRVHEFIRDVAKKQQRTTASIASKINSMRLINKYY